MNTKLNLSVYSILCHKIFFKKGRNSVKCWRGAEHFVLYVYNARLKIRVNITDSKTVGSRQNADFFNEYLLRHVIYILVQEQIICSLCLTWWR
jgi:hypothetical protein